MRLIDADALSRSLMSRVWLMCDGDYYKGLSDERDSTLEAIQDTPTIDARLTVRGKWENSRQSGDYDTYRYEEQCSVCGRWSLEYESPYCPQCGAEMSEVET